MIGRRVILAAFATLPLGACSQMSDLFGSRRSVTVSTRTERLIRWIGNSGRDTQMAPDALTVMGLAPPGRDVPAKQLAEDGPDGRYVVSLLRVRQIDEFVFHRRQGDRLTFHHSDSRFARLSSVSLPRGGRALLITDRGFAENDFQQQIGFWFDRMPGR